MTDFILLEDGTSHLLMEDGSSLLLESANSSFTRTDTGTASETTILAVHITSTDTGTGTDVAEASFLVTDQATIVPIFKRPIVESTVGDFYTALGTIDKRLHALENSKDVIISFRDAGHLPVGQEGLIVLANLNEAVLPSTQTLFVFSNAEWHQIGKVS